jgi:hypothetical protein
MSLNTQCPEMGSRSCEIEFPADFFGFVLKEKRPVEDPTGRFYYEV